MTKEIDQDEKQNQYELNGSTVIYVSLLSVLIRAVTLTQITEIKQQQYIWGLPDNEHDHDDNGMCAAYNNNNNKSNSNSNDINEYL